MSKRNIAKNILKGHTNVAATIIIHHFVNELTERLIQLLIDIPTELLLGCECSYYTELSREVLK